MLIPEKPQRLTELNTHSGTLIPTCQGIWLAARPPGLTSRSQLVIPIRGAWRGRRGWAGLGRKPRGLAEADSTAVQTRASVANPLYSPVNPPRLCSSCQDTGPARVSTSPPPAPSGGLVWGVGDRPRRPSPSTQVVKSPSSIFPSPQL